MTERKTPEQEITAYDTAVLDALKESLAEVGLDTSVEQIVAGGRARRRRRRIGLTACATAVAAGLALGVPSYGHPSTAPPSTELATGAGTVHIRTAAYTVDSLKDGSVRVSWDKQAYFDDHAGLERALHDAGFPVIIKVGEFCKGPGDDQKLDDSGVGEGVDQVMKGRRAADDRVTFDFLPDAMPADTELFIGYLTPEQLRTTDGRPGSVERLVPTDTALTCSTQLPDFG
ncbi:hypothetical protein ABZ848_14620 [Streptomyces sp. NPDC047081]|uniref:hypothetical protein n=1 Tax=Streptomyces sp. NPDC047081 TaxID=3154706 RepID=UPI0033F9E79E